MLDRHLGLDLALRIADGIPFAGFCLGLRHVPPADGDRRPSFRLSIFDEDGESVWDHVQRGTRHGGLEPGKCAHVQRDMRTIRRLPDAIESLDLDGGTLSWREADAYGVELRNAFGERAFVRFAEDGAVHSIATSATKYERPGEAALTLTQIDAGTRSDLSTAVLDDASRPRLVRLAHGEQLSLDYDASGRLASVRSSCGEHLEVEYGAEGAVARLAHSQLGRWEVRFVQDSEWIAVGNGRVWMTRVDEFNHALREQSGELEREIERDPNTGAVTKITTRRRVLESSYDLDGFLVYTSDSSGPPSEFEYDGCGRLVKALVPGAGSYRRVFDDKGRLASIEAPPFGYELRWNDDARSFSGKRTLGGEIAVALRTDSLAAVGDGGRRWVLTPTERGDALWLGSPDGSSIYFQSGPRGSVRWGWPERFERVLERDAGGRLSRVSDAAVNIQCTRDAQGRLRTTSAGCALTHDDHGRIQRVQIGPFVEERSYALDGSIVELQRGGHVVLFESRLGAGTVRYTGTTAFGPSRVELDPWSRISSLSSASIEGRSRPTDERETVESLRLVFEHDENGRVRRASRGAHVLALARDAGGIQSESMGPSEVRSVRDREGGRLALSTSRGLRLTMERDSAGRIATARCEWAREQLEMSFTYDAAGREVAREVGPITLRFERDALGRVVRRTASRGARVLGSTEFRWTGSLLTEVIGIGGWAKLSFTYDRNGTLFETKDAEGLGSQLSGADGPSFGPRLDGVTYDACGLPLARGNTHYQYSPSGHLESTRSGHAVTQFTFDALGQLAEHRSDELHVSYERDAFGRLLSRRSRHYVREPQGRRDELHRLARESVLEMIWDGPRVVHKWSDDGPEHTHVWADGLFVLAIIDGTPHIVAPDPVGDGEALLSIDGDLLWQRDPRTLIFGTVDKGAAGYGLPALPDHHFDPVTGLWHSLFRAFDSSTARYLSPNPLGLAAGPWLHACPTDPIRARARCGIGQPLAPFWSELGADTFETDWCRFVIEQLRCPRDDRGSRAWRALDDDIDPDPQVLMLELARLLENA